jgi:hypothetical protein
MDFNAIIGIPYYLDVEMEEEEEENPLIAVKKYRERRIYVNPSEFFVRFRLSPRLFEMLLKIIGESLCPKALTNNALTAQQKLFIFMRYIASNEFYYELQDTQGNLKVSLLKW